ncbi:MAG: glycosyltransferase [Candidatus Micrarchaeota archaeon]|nr:glycosyltransferase [Candidatus Micrarchaeota archaeon]
MKDKMNISVVIPALNEEKYIESCLKSIKKQTYKPLEIIVCDGNSEDRTREIAKKYADKVVIEKKRSAAAERQKGAMIAKGDVIAFIDSDTIAEKDWLKKIAEAFAKDRKVVAVYGRVLMRDGSKIDKILAHLFTPYIRFTDLIGKPAVAGMNMAVRKDAFKKIGGFNLSLKTAEDIDLFNRIKKEGRIKFVDAVTYTSARRLKHWGYKKFFLFHTTNLIKYTLTGKAKEEYEQVR